MACTLLLVMQPTQLELPLLASTAQQKQSRVSKCAPMPLRRMMERWQATEIFDEFWRYATRRQAILMQRLAGSPPPWTDDPILQGHRFTNPYRLSDRVSQYLLRNVQYDQPRSHETTIFRTLLFKVFNRIDT